MDHNLNVRVPAPEWSLPLLEQYRTLLDIGLHVLLFGLAISPFVMLWHKRKSPAGWTDLGLLVAATIVLIFGINPLSSLLPDYAGVFVRGYALLCFLALVISIVMVAWKIKHRTRGAYATRVLATLTALGLVVMMCLPAVPSAREAARRMACLSNLRTLALALIDVDPQVLDIRTPPPLNDPVVEGGSEVSWRVKLLPYLGNDGLYQQYDSKAAYDSDSNWKVACQKVDAFVCPSEPNMVSPKGGRFTSYAMLVNSDKSPENPKLVYDQKRRLTDANRILLIEACSANIVWTMPRDIDLDQRTWTLKPTRSDRSAKPWNYHTLGSSHHGTVVNTVFWDGSTRSLPTSIDDEVLAKILLGKISEDELD